MDLLFRREQRKWTTRVDFLLWGKVELDEEEQALVTRYDFDGAVLIEAVQPDLLRKGIYAGIGVFLIFELLIGRLLGVGLGGLLGLAAAAFGGWLYIDKHRETIFVRDLIHGRNFKCDSVIELARKEAWLTTIVGYLRQVMESAKHWDGTEQFRIEPLPKEEARLVMIRGL